MHCASSGIKDGIFFLIDIIIPLEDCEKKWKRDNNQFPISLVIVKNFSLKCVFFSDNGLKNQQWTVQLFVEQNQIRRVYHWLQRQQRVTSVTVFGTGWKKTSREFENIRPDTNNKGFT